MLPENQKTESVEDENVRFASCSITFTKKSWWDHFRAFIKSWKKLLIQTLGTFGLLWGFVGSAAYFANLELEGWIFLVLISSVTVTSLVGGIKVYRQTVPEGFELESKEAKEIAHLQKPNWEFELMGILLNEKIEVLDQELCHINDDTHYIAARSLPNVRAYIEWTKLRTVNVQRLLAVSNKLLTSEVVKTLESEGEAPVNPARVVSVVNRIQDFYRETVAFERACHEVAPPQLMFPHFR